MSGRLSMRVEGQPERSFSADFELTGSAVQGELLLSGPLGAGAARARWRPGEAILIGPQGEQQAGDLDALASRALGEAVPMGALFYWLRGRPWPGAAARALPPGETGFEQLGWSVNLARHAEGLVEAVRPEPPPKLTVRVRLASRE